MSPHESSFLKKPPLSNLFSNCSDSVSVTIKIIKQKTQKAKPVRLTPPWDSVMREFLPPSLVVIWEREIPLSREVPPDFLPFALLTLFLLFFSLSLGFPSVLTLSLFIIFSSSLSAPHILIPSFKVRRHLGEMFQQCHV